MPRSLPRPLLLIDGDCGFCTTWSMRLGRWLNDGGPRDVEIRPAGAVDLDALGISTEQTACEVVLALPDGRHYGGAQAFARWLIFRGGPVALLGHLLTLPGVRQLAAAAYRAIAANRYRLPGASDACAIG